MIGRRRLKYNINYDFLTTISKYKNIFIIKMVINSNKITKYIYSINLPLPGNRFVRNGKSNDVKDKILASGSWLK